MVFVDEARIFVKAGNGGKGCESFHAEKLSRYSRPDGGDGGHGGDVILEADGRIQTLLDFRFKQHYKAKNGIPGRGKGKTGRHGEDCRLRVPPGTIIRDKQTRLLIKDLTHEGQSVVVARGGKGGHGNASHKSPTLPGTGEEREIKLELKLIADVGLVGFPNAGKSTLVSGVSRVKSKVANYPFTTKSPVLGFVQGEDFDFIMADLPGMIEGAHQGRGLGDRFLRHAERTKLLVHVIDMGSSEGRDPLDDYATIKEELHAYGGPLVYKKVLLVANKMDLPQAEEHFSRFKKTYAEEILACSALEHKGLDLLIRRIRELLCQESSRDQSEESSSS